jgi:hypothetical protein
MKRQKIIGLKWLMGIVAVSFLLSGCAAGTATSPTQAAAPSSMENLLVQAGFKLFPQNSPLCQKVCKKIPPGQLVPHKKGGKTVYAYVSPDATRLYGGDEAAYQRFINLAVQKNLDSSQRTVTPPNTGDPEFWTMWENSQGG